LIMKNLKSPEDILKIIRALMFFKDPEE